LVKGLKQLALLVLLAARHAGEWDTWHPTHQEV
jgi:hypothetical protein